DTRCLHAPTIADARAPPAGRHGPVLVGHRSRPPGGPSGTSFVDEWHCPHGRASADAAAWVGSWGTGYSRATMTVAWARSTTPAETLPSRPRSIGLRS